MESGASALTPSQSNELHFLRSRVRELERERAELSAENQRLKTMLVHGESGSKCPAPPVRTCDTKRHQSASDKSRGARCALMQ